MPVVRQTRRKQFRYRQNTGEQPRKSAITQNASRTATTINTLITVIIRSCFAYRPNQLKCRFQKYINLIHTVATSYKICNRWSTPYKFKHPIKCLLIKQPREAICVMHVYISTKSQKDIARILLVREIRSRCCSVSDLPPIWAN